MRTFILELLMTALAVALTRGIAWSQYDWTKDARNPVLSGGASGTWDYHVAQPCVLYNSDSSRYEMWYSGSFNLARPYRIGFATSPDGINWQRDTAHNPVLTPDTGTWDESSVESPCVIRENGQYKMWYSGWRGYDINIGYAVSSDGVNWQKDVANNPVLSPGASDWEDRTVGYCTIEPQAGQYFMYYCGGGTASGGIGRATSLDGINWDRDTFNNPLLVPGLPGEWDDYLILLPWFVDVEGDYYMFYTAFQTNLDGARRVGLATSTDGTDWQKAAQNPVLAPSPGRWDGLFVEGGTVLMLNDTLHMWYGGTRDPADFYRWRIGHATAPVSVVGVGEQDGTLPNDYSLYQNHPNPFNPSTTIDYALPRNSSVRLEVFNVLGEKVRELVDGSQDAGYHSVTFDSEGLPSGIYFCRLRTGEFVETMKMLLLK